MPGRHFAHGSLRRSPGVGRGNSGERSRSASSSRRPADMTNRAHRRITTLALIGGLLLGTESTEATTATATTKTTTAPAKTARKKAATTTKAAPAKTAASPTAVPAAVESTATNAVPPPSAPPAETGDGDDMTMPGRREGRVLRSLTIAGEDRVRPEFARPT